MTNVGYATLTVLPSAKGFASALGGEIDGPMARAGKDGGERSGGAFAGAFRGLVGPAIALVATAGIGSFVSNAIAQAGELEQSVGAIETVFKGSSAQMLEWSDSAAMAVGLTSNQYNSLGTLIGSQLKNAGVPMDELAGKTNTMITLGADMASMFGGTTTEAVEALSSALKGEMDPIERYGVTLNAAAIESEAAAMGLQKVGGEFDDTAKKAAIMSLITKQTADAQGNFAKEANTYAGQLERMKAGYGNITAAIGGAFLPVLTSTFGWINSNAIPVLQSWADAIGQGGVQKALTGLSDLLLKGDFTSGFREAFNVEEDSPLVDLLFRVREAILPVIDAFQPLGSVIGSLVTSFSPLSLLFQALMPVLPALLSTFSQLGVGIAGTLTVALAGLVPLIQTFVSSLSGVFVAIMPAVVAMVTVLGTAFTQLVPVVMSVLGAVLPLATTLLTQLAPIITNLVTAILPPVVSIFGNIVNAVAPLVSMIAALLIPAISALMPVVVTVFQVVADVIASAMQIVQGIIQVATGLITGNWENVWAGIGNILSGAWGLITGLVSGAVKVLGALIGAALSYIGSLWNMAWSGISSFLGGVWSNISSAVSGGIGSVVSFFSGLWGRITGAIGDIGSKMGGIGRNIIEGLANGISNAAGLIRDAVKNAIGNVVDFAKNLLGIHSPSRVFMEIGDFTAQGMAVGLTKGAKHVQKAAAKSLVPPAPSFASPDVTAGGVRAGAESGALPTGSPLIGSLTLQSSGNVREDMDEVLFHTRRISRGGVYA